MNICILVSRPVIRQNLTNVAQGLELLITPFPDAQLVIADRRADLEKALNERKHALQIIWDPHVPPAGDLLGPHAERFKIYRVIEDAEYGGWTHMWDYIRAVRGQLEGYRD